MFFLTTPTQQTTPIYRLFQSIIFCWLPLFKLLFFLGFLVFYWFLQAISLWHISFLLLRYYGIITSRKIVFIPGALTTGKVKGLLSKAYTAFIIVSLLHKMCLCKFTRLKRNFLRVSILLLRYLLENCNESWVLGFSKKMSSKNMLQCS